MSEQNPQGALAAAIAACSAAIGYVQKTGQANFGGRYSYASDADLLRKAQPAMAEHGLALVPIDVQWTPSDVQGKKTERRAEVIVTYRLMHEGGGHVDISAPGEGMDSRDKAVYKAMTGAYKYAIRQAFAVPTGDDAEQDPPAAPQRGSERPQGPPPPPETSWDDPSQYTPGQRLNGAVRDAGLTAAKFRRYLAAHGEDPAALTDARKSDLARWLRGEEGPTEVMEWLGREG